MNLTLRILIGMGAGLLLGITVQQLGLDPSGWVRGFLVDGVLDAGGQIFIASLKLMVVPLVFVSLVCGAARLGASASMGRLGGKTLGMYLLTTALAVTLALTTALIVEPGIGADAPPADIDYQPKPAPSVKETLVNIFPTNPVAAMAEGRMPAACFSTSTKLVPPPRRRSCVVRLMVSACLTSWRAWTSSSNHKTCTSAPVRRAMPLISPANSSSVTGGTELDVSTQTASVWRLPSRAIPGSNTGAGARRTRAPASAAIQLFRGRR